MFCRPFGLVPRPAAQMARPLVWPSVNTINYTVHTAILLHFNLWPSTTCLGHYIWPSSGSSYKITERIHKRTVTHIVNKIKAGIQSFSMENIIRVKCENYIFKFMLSLYIYACVYICMHIYMHVYIYACVYICMCIYMCMYIYIFVYALSPRLCKTKAKGISIQALTGRWVCRRLGITESIDNRHTKVASCPGRIKSIKKSQWYHRESNPRPSSLAQYVIQLRQCHAID
jgi:hypothetical protein